MPFDSRPPGYNLIASQDIHSNAALEVQIEHELDMIGEELAAFWENEFEKHPERYPTMQSRLDKVRSVRDIREGKDISHLELKFNERIVNSEALREQMRAAAEEAVEALSHPENFLGNGKTADVFRLNKSPNVCIKFIARPEAYQEETAKLGANTIETETEFLQAVEGMVMDGVRAPEYYFLMSGNHLGYCMEALPALNVSSVLNRLVSFRESDRLDPKRFGEQLENYIRALHAKGILHGDLANRNVMIDKETLSPRVIDFGKAKWISMLESQDRDTIVRNELATAHEIASQLANYQKNKREDEIRSKR